MNWGQSDSTADRALALHVAYPDLILSIPYDPLSPSGAITEHHQVMVPKQILN